MTHLETLDITGPVRITIKGPQGSGKSQLAKAIAAHLESLNLSTIIGENTTPKDERRWRKPYASQAAKVMIVEKQGKVV